MLPSCIALIPLSTVKLLPISSLMIPKSLIKTQCKFYSNIYAFEIIVDLLQENTIFLSHGGRCAVFDQFYM